MNWFPYPFVRACLPFILGILLCTHVNIKISYDYIFLILIIGLHYKTAFQKYSPFNLWRFGVVFNLSFFLLGYIFCFHTNDLNHPNFFGNNLPDEKTMIKGIVDELPVEKNWLKLVIQTNSILKDSIWYNHKGKLLIYLEPDSNSQKLTYGDEIVFFSEPSPISPPNNPHAFDYQKFLKYQNIHFQSYIHKNEWKLLKTEQGNFILSSAYRIRSKFLKVLRKHLNGENEYAVGAALILGYKTELSEEVRAAYSETGAIHVLAVSGLHVGIIYLFLSYLIRPMYSDPNYIKYGKLLILLSAIWSFAVLTGASPSVLRAATMFSFFIWGKYGWKYSFAYNTLAASAFFLLVWNPFLLFQVGFQLSYAAVAGIIFFQNRLRVLWVSMNNFFYHIWQLTTVAISAQLTVLPLSLLYFHQIPVYFLLTGFVVVDAAFIILLLGIILLILETVQLSFLANWIGLILDRVLWLVNSFIFSVQKLPYGLIENIYISSFSTLLMYFIIWEIAQFWRTKKYSKLVWGGSFFLIFSCFFAIQQYQNFDKKQVIIYDAGAKNTLIDFVFEQKIICLKNSNIDNKTIEYNVNSNRKALGINDITTINIDSTHKCEFENLLWKKPFAQFFNKRIALVNSRVKSDSIPVKTDFILLRDNPEIKVKELQKIFSFKKLISDASNKFWKTKKWEEECKEQGVSFHNIKRDGTVFIQVD